MVMHAIAPALIGATFMTFPFATLGSASPASKAAARGRDVEIPRNDGWVTDLGGMLNPAADRALEKLLASYEQGSTHEIALLTVPSLDGQPIENLARKVGRAWGIGGEDMTNGALLVVSKEDRAVRIEVGRGLEDTLTDEISARIIRDVIVPEFQNGDYVTGIRQGIEVMHAAIGGDYARVRRTRPYVPDPIADVERILPQVLLAILWFFVRVSSALRRGSRRRPLDQLARAGGRGSDGGGFSGSGGGGGFSGGGASGGW